MRILFRLFLLFIFGLIAFPALARAEPEILIQLPFTETLVAQASGFPREPVQPNPDQTSEANPNLLESSAGYTVSDPPVLMAQLKTPIEKETEIEERPDTLADPLA